MRPAQAHNDEYERDLKERFGIAPVAAACHHIQSGLTRLLGLLCSTSLEQRQEVVELVRNAYDQQLRALAAGPNNLRGLAVQAAFNKQLAELEGGGEWKALSNKIDDFCSGAAQLGGVAAPDRRRLRRELANFVNGENGWVQQALQRVSAAQAEVTSMAGRLMQGLSGREVSIAVY